MIAFTSRKKKLLAEDIIVYQLIESPEYAQ